MANRGGGRRPRRMHVARLFGAFVHTVGCSKLFFLGVELWNVHEPSGCVRFWILWRRNEAA